MQDLAAARPKMRRYYRKPLSDGRLPDEHFCDRVPDCISLPPCDSAEELTRWKLPRDVFQALFMKKTDHIRRLDPLTLSHLKGSRSDDTLRVVLEPEGATQPGNLIERRAIPSFN